jgi:hypothetical protein
LPFSSSSFNFAFMFFHSFYLLKKMVFPSIR